MAAVVTNRPLVFLALLFAISLVYSGCEKEDLDPDYPFKVVVKTQKDSLLAANTFVEAFAPIPDGRPYFEGFTNENGEITFSYGQAAILFVRASRGPKVDYLWLGCGEVYLEANKQVTKVIYIEQKQGNNDLVGCSFD